MTASLHDVLGGAGLVVCATGNLALRGDDFARLANGAYLASVTSSEDELDLTAVHDFYDSANIGEHITRYSTVGHYFYLLTAGNAVNFLHGASVGPFIHLVQAEILSAAAQLSSSSVEPGLHEVSDSERQRIASLWLSCFPEGTLR